MESLYQVIVCRQIWIWGEKLSVLLKPKHCNKANFLQLADCDFDLLGTFCPLLVSVYPQMFPGVDFVALTGGSGNWVSWIVHPGSLFSMCKV